METRDLQTFLAVAESGSITRAATALGRSQPSVSRTIQDLEAELGFDLLLRTGRRVQLSEEGIAFEEEARRLLMSFTELAARARNIAAGKGRILQIATTSAIGTGLLPKALAELGTDALPHETHIGQFLPPVVAQEVRSGRAEIGFSSLPLDTPGLRVLRLFMAPNAIALPENDPLAAEATVPVEALQGRTMVTMLNPLRFQMHVARVLASRGIRTGKIIRTNISYGALETVAATGAAAIIDPVSAWGVHVPGVVVRPIDAEIPFYWGALAAEHRAPGATAQALLTQVEALASRVITGFATLDPALAGTLVAGAQVTTTHGTD